MKPSRHRLPPSQFAALLLASLLPGIASAALAPGETSVSTTVFINASDLQRKNVRADGEGWGLDLRRFYIDVEHRFDPRWSARVTTDVQWIRQQDPTDLWFKHAYLQGDFGKALTLRVGAAPLPWPAFTNKWSGYRYVDQDLVTREGVGGSSDWGVHAAGELTTGGSAGYAVSAVTGAGFKRPRTGERIDVDARVHWQPTANSVLGLGTYRGTLAQDVGNAPKLHTAERWSALAAYADDRMRIGMQWFRAENWNRVSKAAPDASHGWSAWASWQFSPTLAAFARHDRTNPSLCMDPSQVRRFDQVGVEWMRDKHLRVALVGKRDARDSTAVRLVSNEIGLWAQLNY